MERALEMMWNALTSSLSNLWAALAPALQRLDPLTWGMIATALFILLLLLMLLRRRPEEPALGKPELLVSLGEIRVLDDYVEPDDVRSGTQDGHRGGLMRPVSHALRITVSNLNTYPVQLLEVALVTPEMDAPVTLETVQIVAPEGSVVIKETLPELVGEAGKLTLYFYLSGGSKRYVALQASFAFEPWDARYKVSPLGQTLTPFRQLASDQASKHRERDWQEQQARAAQQERQEKVTAFRDTAPTQERPRSGFNFPDEF